MIRPTNPRLANSLTPLPPHTTTTTTTPTPPQRPRGVDPRLLDERCLEVSQKDALDLMSSLDLSPADLKGKPNALAGLLFNNPLVRLLQLKRIVAALRFVKEAFLDSFEGPNARRLLWPGSVALVLALWFGNAVESLPLK